MHAEVDSRFGLPAVRAPFGAVRIFARDSGRSILIEAGTDREAGEEERLAGVWWFASEEIAASVVEQCMDFLFAARFYPVDDWITFPAAKVGNLIDTAKTHLNVTTVTRMPESVRPERSRWTHARCAWLGYLVGLGWEAKRIADDPLIKCTANNVYRQAHKLDLSFSGTSNEPGALRLPIATGAVYDRAAARLGLTRDAMIRRTIIAVASDPAMIDRLLSTD